MTLSLHQPKKHFEQLIEHSEMKELWFMNTFSSVTLMYGTFSLTQNVRKIFKSKYHRKFYSKKYKSVWYNGQKHYRTKQIHFMNFAIRIMLSQHRKSSTVPVPYVME
jgi:phosphoribosyl-AMP cyclohydrolase